jgi:hypothetical protein
MRAAIAAALLTLLGSAAPAAERPGMLTRVVHADAALWLLDDDGLLRRLPDASEQAKAVAAPGRPVDLCRRDGAVLLATRDGDRLTVLRRAGSGWTAVGGIPLARDERPVGMACGGARPVLLTTRQVAELGAGSRPLGGDLPRGFRHVLYRDGDSLLVGSNAGEWGGGLVRIALATGAVAAIEGAGAPVQDIAAAPGKPGCVLVAVGLVHFFSSGRLTELCGARARPLLEAPEPGARNGYPSAAFFALAPARDGLVAIGTDGQRPVTAAGVGAPAPLPRPVRRGDDWVDASAPDRLLVYSGINARGSVGGGMPLVAPR